ncbi:zinc finger, C3HC4 type (RING finger) protein [Toxoplasma gondii RUB]|uniref:Zinc finger, C3HC4 type (RING finger) protein n=1 Tax=Toxoplasma gondii RUB TaxID=935652 RepID=A0A086M4B3_TOXGO|nr:zinc finger, C3HC4 type (RING finger) protein [Toxoplasma gondii RUB]
MDFGASSPRSTFSSSTDASPERLSLPPFYIFSFLSPFAASASLPSLTSPLGASAVLAGKEVVDWSTCPICLQVLCRPVCGPCQHVACGGCFVGSLQWRQKCPVCNRAMKASDLECMRSPDASNGRSEATSREEQSSSSSQPPSSLSAPDPSSSLASPSRRPSDRSAPPLAGAADVGPPPTATAAVCAQPPRQRSLGTSPAAATTAAAAAAAVSAAAAATVTATLAGGTDTAVNAAGDVKDGASAAATVISAVLSSDELEAGEEEVPREARAARAATARSADTQGEGGEREDPQSAAFGGDGTDENAMIARVQKLLEEERRRELAKKTEETRGQGNGDRASETEPPGLESREEQIIRMCDSYYERVLAARDGRKSEVSSSFSSSALGSSFASAVSVTSTLYWRLLLRCDLCGEVVAMHRSVFLLPILVLLLAGSQEHTEEIAGKAICLRFPEHLTSTDTAALTLHGGTCAFFVLAFFCMESLYFLAALFPSTVAASMLSSSRRLSSPPSLFSFLSGLFYFEVTLVLFYHISGQGDLLQRAL